MNNKLFFIIILILLFLFFLTQSFSQEYKPGDHELLIMPTAYTMPVNTSYFSDYEVVMLNYSYAVTSRTHIGTMVAFPYYSEFYESFSLGIKQNYFASEYFSLAAFASFTFEDELLIVGNVASIGTVSHGFHAGIAYFKQNNHDHNDWIFMLGYRIDPSEKTSLILEYTNAQSSKNDLNWEGIVSLAFRVRSDYMAWELGGIRPIEAGKNVLLIPALKITYYFH